MEHSNAVEQRGADNRQQGYRHLGASGLSCGRLADAARVLGGSTGRRKGGRHSHCWRAGELRCTGAGRSSRADTGRMPGSGWRGRRSHFSGQTRRWSCGRCESLQAKHGPTGQQHSTEKLAHWSSTQWGAAGQRCWLPNTPHAAENLASRRLFRASPWPVREFR